MTIILGDCAAYYHTVRLMANVTVCQWGLGQEDKARSQNRHCPFEEKALTGQ